MDFSLSEDQLALADVLGRFLRDRYGLKVRSAAAAQLPGHDRRIWQQLAEMGVIGALFDPAVGGFGGNPFDVTAIFETLGSALVAEPVLPALMAGTILAGAASPVLEALIDGRWVIAVALFEQQGRYDATDVRTTALAKGDGWQISGAKSVVHFAEAADVIIVSAREESGEIGLFLVPPHLDGVTMRGFSTHDGLRAADIDFDGVDLPADARIGAAAPVTDKAIALGTLALCAEALGIMEWLKNSTLDYLRTRVQFGSPIGRNQALQHRMAELVVEIEQARSAVIRAAGSMDGDARERDRAVSAAKFTIGETALLVAEESIQMHGGIGMTQELDLSHFAKRAVMIDHQLGDVDYHLGRYMALTAN